MSIDKLNQYKSYYDRGLWTIKMVDQLLEKGRITQEEYDYITGKVTENT